jgi:hypothetical protein
VFGSTRAIPERSFAPGHVAGRRSAPARGRADYEDG